MINLQEIGGDVVATGSGTADLTELDLDFESFGAAFIAPPSSNILIGTSESSGFHSSIAGPTSFGSGSTLAPNSSVGTRWGVFDSFLVVPEDYDSGDFLSSTSTWNNTTLVDLGVTPGTYTWTWGSGINQDSLTLNAVGATAVPEPSSLLLLGIGCCGLMHRRKSRGHVKESNSSE